jgi:acyl carrier protein
MSALYDTVANILTAKLKVPANEIHPDASLKELGLDSLALVELAMTLEDVTGGAVSEDKLTFDLTLSEAVEVLAAAGVHA